VDGIFIAIAIPFFFLLIGVEVYVDRKRRREGKDPLYRFADSITSLSCGVGQQILGALALGALQIGAYALVHDTLRIATVPTTSTIGWVLAFLGVDLAYYLWHRFTHEVSVGWITHVVHHQSEDYNLAVALRQSMTSSLSSWPFYLPLAVVGVPPEVFFLHAALNTLYQFWIHTETIGRMGPLEWVINTPSHHRVHHAVNPQYVDKNYAGVLIVWDRLFGTFAPERETPVYGTVEPLKSFDPLWANVWFFAERARDTLRARTWSDRVRLWLGKPSFVPAGVAPYPPAPQTRQDQVKHDPRGLPGTGMYVLAWFVPVAAATTSMMVVAKTAPTAVLVTLLVLVLWTTWTWGGLFERKAWAVPAELARLGVVAGATTVGTLGGPYALVGPMGIAVCAGSAAALLVISRRTPVSAPT
jgi:alkylglycerol monooxygenase